MKQVRLFILLLLTSMSLLGCEQDLNTKKDPLSLSSELQSILSLTESMPQAHEHLFEQFSNLYGEAFKGNATKEKFEKLARAYSPVTSTSNELSVLITANNGLTLKVLIHYNQSSKEYEIYDVQVVEN